MPNEISFSRRSGYLLAFVLVALIPGFLGAYFTTANIPTWYAGLNKPPYLPPNEVFGPVWTMLYILIGISGYIVWMESKGNLKVFRIYALQLLLNFLWSYMFFGLRNPSLGFITIVALWIAVLLNIIVFRKISKRASYLLIPYILWITFASYLNLGVLLLN